MVRDGVDAISCSFEFRGGFIPYTPTRAVLPCDSTPLLLSRAPPPRAAGVPRFPFRGVRGRARRNYDTVRGIHGLPQPLEALDTARTPRATRGTQVVKSTGRSGARDVVAPANGWEVYSPRTTYDTPTEPALIRPERLSACCNYTRSHLHEVLTPAPPSRQI